MRSPWTVHMSSKPSDRCPGERHRGETQAKVEEACEDSCGGGGHAATGTPGATRSSGAGKEGPSPPLRSLQSACGPADTAFSEFWQKRHFCCSEPSSLWSFVTAATPGTTTERAEGSGVWRVRSAGRGRRRGRSSAPPGGQSAARSPERPVTRGLCVCVHPRDIGPSLAFRYFLRSHLCCPRAAGQQMTGRAR